MRTLRLSLAGVAMLVLLGGRGLVAVGQDESAAPAALPTGPAAFEILLQRTDEGAYTFTATDPRFSGNLTFDEGVWIEVLPGQTVMADTKRVENEAGAWEGPSSGYIWGDGGKNQQTWWVGEGAFEGLNAVTINTAEGLRGLIFEGDVPLWKYCQPLPAE